MTSRLLVRIALKTLGRSKWGWRALEGWGFIKRNNAGSKCAAIVAHDRILCGEIYTRGTPSFYGQKK